MNKTRLLSSLGAMALLATPAAAHFDENQIWITDFSGNAMYRVLTDTWQVFTANPAVFPTNRPGSIHFNLHGHMLVSDFQNSTIWERDGDGVLVNEIGPAAGLAGPYGAGGIVIGPGHGDIYVTNNNTGEILQFTDELELEGVFADGSDGLVKPGAMAFLMNGDMLVADRGTKEIYLFDTATGTGVLWDVFHAVPLDIAVRDNKDVYILDNSGRIYRYPGGVVASKVLLGKWGEGNGAMTMSHDQTVIYHVNPLDSELREIDPVTGDAVVRATIPGLPTGIAMPGAQYVPGSFIEFGEALAGTGGIDPVLHGHGEPRIGDPATIGMHDFLGGAPIYLFLSLGMDEAEYFGGEFHIDLFDPSTFWYVLPADGTPGLAGDGDFSLNFTMPNEPILVGTKWTMQALGIDPGAVQGVSFSPCSVMYIGE